MKETNVYIFVGEFSYAMNWHSPKLQLILQQSNSHNIVVTLPAYSMLYRRFVDEVHPLPEHIWSKLGKLSMIGERIPGIPEHTPKIVIDYCKELFPDANIITPSNINPYEQNPMGIYEHLIPSLECKSEIEIFLNNFDKNNTIAIFPKYRKVGGVLGQNWKIENWERLIGLLLDNDYNIVVLQILDKLEKHGGTYEIGIVDDKVRIYNVDRNDPFALDKQSWLLKLTKCSIYGSTGAASLPHWLDTPSCSIMKGDCGRRLFFDWQKKLTNNHKNNEIILLEDLENSKFEDIQNIIIDYINRI